MPKPRELLPADVLPRSSRCLCTALHIQLTFGSLRIAWNKMKLLLFRSLILSCNTSSVIIYSDIQGRWKIMKFQYVIKYHHISYKYFIKYLNIMNYLMCWINQNNFIIFIWRILSNPITVQNSQTSTTTTNTFLKISVYQINAEKW